MQFNRQCAQCDLAMHVQIFKLQKCTISPLRNNYPAIVIHRSSFFNSGAETVCVRLFCGAE